MREVHNGLPMETESDIDGMGEFRGRSRYVNARYHSCGLGIPFLEILERFSDKLGVGFHLIALSESCKYQ